MKAEQERTLADGIPILCAPSLTLNHDGFLISGGCRSAKVFFFFYY